MATPQLTTIYNFLPSDERWATAGQPTAEQFTAIAQASYEVVINLGMSDSPRAIVLGVPLNDAGQTLHQIWEPNSIWQQFIDEQLAKGEHVWAH